MKSFAVAPIPAVHGPRTLNQVSRIRREIPENSHEARWISLLPRAQVYPAGTELYSQGAKAREVYFLQEGFAKLVWVNPLGRELIVGLRHLRCFLGLAAAILDLPHPTSAVTVSQSKLARVPREFLLDLMIKNQEISATVTQMLSQEVCEQTERLTQLGSLSSSQRVKNILFQMVTICHKEVPQTAQEIRLMLPLKQCEIASVLAMTPEHLSRTLKHLCNQGIIRWQKGWLVVPDINQLQCPRG